MANVTASGSASATAPSAVIVNKRSYRLIAAGSATASGQAVVGRTLPAGGLTDLGVWLSGRPDSAMSRAIIRGGEGIGTDATAARGYTAATAPKEYNPTGSGPLWNSAAYAAVGIKWTNVPVGQTHAFSQVQFEGVNLGNRLSWAATSWEEALCYTAHSSVHFATVSRTSVTAFSGKYCGRLTYAGHSNPSGIFGYTMTAVNGTGMTPCTPGEVVGGSVAVRMSRAAWWSVGLHFYDANFDLINDTWYYQTQSQHPGGDQWAVSSAYNITAPANTAWVAAIPHISVNSTWDARDNVAVAGEVAYVDMHRVWTYPYNVKGIPTAYESPKKLTIDIKANRVNIINNPSFETNLRGWGVFGTGTMPYPIAHDSMVGRSRTGAMKFTSPANPTSYGVSSVFGAGLLTSWDTDDVGGFGWKTSTLYTASIFVKRAPDCPNVTFYVGYTPITGVLSTDEAESHPELWDGEWVRLWATFMTSERDNGLVVSNVGINKDEAQATGAEALFWVDDALCEEGTVLRDYFDGNSPGSDYLWAGDEGFSSSHYYRDFRANAYRMEDIVKSAAPLGTRVEIRYAQAPM